jgi:hypothetical protein
MTWSEIVATAALIVSIVSAAFAFYAPRRTENLRRKTSQKERELNIFSILMSERGRWGSANMLTAMNAVKVVFRDCPNVLDKWFVCYSKVNSPSGTADQYHDLLAEIGKQIGLPMRREDLEHFFVNPVEQKEFAVRSAEAHRAYLQLSANTTPTVVE